MTTQPLSSYPQGTSSTLPALWLVLDTNVSWALWEAVLERTQLEMVPRWRLLTENMAQRGWSEREPASAVSFTESKEALGWRINMGVWSLGQETAGVCSWAKYLAGESSGLGGS